MAAGYLYCFSNSSLPGILKVGMSEQTPDIVVSDANRSKWRPPTPYNIEFAIRVSNPKEKESKVRKVLSQYGKETGTNRDFYRVSIEQLRVLFDCFVEDQWWDMTSYIEECDVEPEIEVEKFVFNGVEYLKSKDNVLYDIETHHYIGWWDEDDNVIDMF